MSSVRCINSLRGGFTLFEVLITVAIIAMIAVSVLPTLHDDTRLRLMAASSIVVSDIELAQVMTISDPQNAVVVRFEPDQNQYWLALASSPETPINRADTGEPYLVVMGQGRAASASGVSLTTSDIPDQTLGFNAQGGVADFTTEPRVTLEISGQTIHLDIATTTGTITETDGGA